MKKKIIAIALCGLMLAGCSTKEDSSEEPLTTTAPVPTEPVDLETAPSEEMYNRAILSEGNLDRLAAKLKEAKDENSEPLTIGFIGGSITQGSSSSGNNASYAEQVQRWFSINYGKAVNYVNAGVGATDSYIGAHRVAKDIVEQDPDVVFVEFSVNDTREFVNRDSYDSLVRSILKAESNPAVILIFTTMEDGTSFQEIHKEIGEAYDLPMISYHDAIIPEVNANTLNWKDISPDNIHPNNAGHKILGELLIKFISNVDAKLDTINGEVGEFTTEPVTTDKYSNASILNRDTLNVIDEGEWTKDVSFQTFSNGWGTEKAGSSLKFEVEAKNIGLLFKKTTNDKSGMAEIYVDGELKSTLEGNFPNGWGNYVESSEVFASNDTSKHTVEIKVVDGSKTEFQILGVLVS